MKKKFMWGAMVVVVFAMLMGCATVGHQYVMRGSILDVNDGTAYLCIGTEQGAKVGQEFTVYRYVPMYGSTKEEGPQYRVETVGKVKITKTESHMANAKILSGDVRKYDVVELNP